MADFRVCTLLSSGPGYAIGEWGRHLIAVWDGVPSAPAVTSWGQQLERLVRAHPRRVTYISYLRSGFGVPVDVVRQSVVGTLKRVDGSLVGVAVVLPGRTFLDSAARALVSGLVLAVRPKSPMRSLASLDESHAWLGSLLAPGLEWGSLQDMREAVAMLETHITPGPMSAPPPSTRGH